MMFAYIALVSSVQTISVGIWAGKETIAKRVLAQAQTWMRMWDHVHVFTDEVVGSDCELVQAAAAPCNVTCVALGNLAEHLEETEWTHRWYFAQPRFLPSMAALWELNLDSHWFVFGDDDTYMFRPNIEERAATLKSNETVVVGKFWSSWERVTQKIPPQRDSHPFAQGGAGVLISAEMMRRIGPHLRNCSLSMNDPDFAGSMRFAICAERVIGQREWSLGRTIVSGSNVFHSGIPQVEIGAREIGRGPATFHQVKPDAFKAIWQAHTAEYTERDDRKVIVDMATVAFTRCRIALGHETNYMEWRIGYWIAVEDGKVPLLHAKEGWRAKLEGDKIVGFAQSYEDGVEVICVCDETAKEPQFVRFEDAAGSKPIVKLPCSNFSVRKM